MVVTLSKRKLCEDTVKVSQGKKSLRCKMIVSEEQEIIRLYVNSELRSENYEITR